MVDKNIKSKKKNKVDKMESFEEKKTFKTRYNFGSGDKLID